MNMTPFVCPLCRKELSSENASMLLCANCGRKYPVQNSIPFLTSTLEEHEAIEQKFWDWQYSSEVRKAAPLLSFHHHFLASLRSLPAGSRVLEIACGTRADALNLAPLGHELFFTDISGSALWSVRDRASNMKISIPPSYAVADAEHLPFGDEMFDGVLTVASLHHAHDTLGMLLEMKRVVKPNGWVVVGVEPASWPYTIVYPLLWPIKRLIRIIRKRPINSVADDETRGFTRDGLKKIFFEAGLEVIEVKSAKFLLEVYDSFCRLLEQLLRRPVKPRYSVERILDGIDRLIALVPVLNRFPWHWSVIARKRAQ